MSWVAHEPLVRETRQRHVRFAVAIEPRFGHDERFDQRLTFVARHRQLLPVRFDVGGIDGHVRIVRIGTEANDAHAFEHRPLERVGAERRRVDPRLPQEPGFEARHEGVRGVHVV